MKIVIKDYGTHTMEETYEITNYFCPSCGKQKVYEEQGFGDYYCGVDFVCVNCGTVFDMPHITKGNEDKILKQVVDQLK